MVKSFCIAIFVLGMFFPVVTIEIEAVSTDNRFEDFTDDFVIIYTNHYSEGEIVENSGEVAYKSPQENKIVTWSIQFFVFIGLAIISLSLLADILEKEEGFIGEWTSTFTGAIMLLISYLIMMVQSYLLENDTTVEDGKLRYDRVPTSRGTVSFYIRIEETIFYRLMQIALAAFLILPITNRLIKEKYPYDQATTMKIKKEEPVK